jgi:quercetin dioxygenase-like cupin family protein
VLGSVAAAAAFSCALAQQISIPSAKQEEILRRTSNTWNKPLTFPSRLPEVTAALIEYPPGTSAERQINRYSRYLYVVEGTLTLDVEGRGPVAFPAGTLIISGNTWLTPKNNGAVYGKAAGDRSNRGWRIQCAARETRDVTVQSALLLRKVCWKALRRNTAIEQQSRPRRLGCLSVPQHQHE